MVYEEYIKEYIIKEKTEEEHDMALMSSIIETKKELENANKNYEYAEGELIDYYLYQIKACQSKLNYLLKKAKNKGIILDRIKEVKLRKEQESKVV